MNERLAGPKVIANSNAIPGLLFAISIAQDRASDRTIGRSGAKTNLALAVAPSKGIKTDQRLIGDGVTPDLRRVAKRAASRESGTATPHLPAPAIEVSIDRNDPLTSRNRTEDAATTTVGPCAVTTDLSAINGTETMPALMNGGKAIAGRIVHIAKSNRVAMVRGDATTSDPTIATIVETASNADRPTDSPTPAVNLSGEGRLATTTIDEARPGGRNEKTDSNAVRIGHRGTNDRPAGPSVDSTMADDRQ